MSTSQVRIRTKDKDKLQELSRLLGSSMTETFSKILESYRRKLILKQVNEAYAKLKADPEAWRQYKEEQKLWDATLSDGLDGL